MNKIITQIGLLIFCFAVITLSMSKHSVEQIFFRAASLAIAIVMVLSVLVIIFFRIINKTSVEKSKINERKQVD